MTLPRPVPGVDLPRDPSGDEARSDLRRELLDPEYHQQDALQRLLTWVERLVARTVEAASGVPTVTVVAATLVAVLLLAALGWLLSLARRTARAPVGEGPVLSGERLTADQLRARAEAALGDGRPGDAVVDGFRALAVRQVELGRLEDRPGATAHEVARTVAAHDERLAGEVTECARLFDLVRYGGRSATAEQAAGVLRLDDSMAGVR